MCVTPTLFCAIFILGITGCLSSLRQCDDCIPLPECDIASNLVKKDKSNNRQATISIIKNSICDTWKRNGKTIGVSVCCSDFLASRMHIGDDIENHKNRILLPNSRDCGRIHGNKVIGGSKADIGEFPWMVMFMNRNKVPVCGASLINERYILTAAHCVSGLLPYSTKVRLGEYDLHKGHDCHPIYKNYCIEHIDLDISEIKVHPEYKYRPSLVNDIALVRLASPANFSYHNIQPICLPIPSKLRNSELDDKIAIIAGWGQAENNVGSGVLRKADIRVLNETMCNSIYPNSTKANKFCAGNEGKDTCKGDSGGPIMFQDKYYDSYKVVQFGVVSYGYILCNGVYPGVYVDVRPYLKWILDTIQA